MYQVPVPDALKGKSKELQSQFDEIKGTTTLISIIVSVVGLTMLGVLIMTTPPLDRLGFGDSNLGTGLGVVFLIFAIITGILVPIIFVSSWMDRYWKHHYRQAWSWLKYTDLSQLVVDEGRWEEIFTQMATVSFLRFINIQRPAGLDEQIELASDFRRALMVLTRGAPDGDPEQLQRRLARAVWWGCLTRYLDNLTQVAFSTCLLWGCLMFGGVLWYSLGLPIWLPVLGLYIRRQAWQLAMIDYFSGKPTYPVRGVKAPAGFGNE